MLSQEQIDALVAKGIEKADAGDSLMLEFMLEQIFGKAPQPLTGDGLFKFKALRLPRQNGARSARPSTASRTPSSIMYGGAVHYSAGVT
jgi:hypothetical protein